jgi:hypothetical protein
VREHRQGGRGDRRHHMHSAFRITMSRKTSSLPTEVLHGYRNMFVSVKCVIVDEISMLSSAVLHKINQKLQQINAVYDFR